MEQIEQVDLHEIAVEALLEGYQRLKGRTTYDGDYNAVDTLLDLREAIERADLTDRQHDVIRLAYAEGYTHKEVGKQLGTSRPNVTLHCQAAVRKIADIYRQWEELENEIQPT